ncbi:MAG: recombination protein RecR [Bacteroidetes bacterium CG02_land_8_20_14_3_00_31_25]|nr:MAG: recombination protein RecR [Bacteroidetes bacterium CG02_land_8_20_14_3_00_31_25]
MNANSYPSKLLEKAVNEFSKLPGIGNKTAFRLVMHLLKQGKSTVSEFANSLITLSEEIKYCKQCHNISDNDICEICSDPRRDSNLLCVVESVKDVIAIENTHQYKGLYHVLGGLISPMDGVSPSELNITTLEEKASSGKFREIILALSTTMEGDTTNFYIFKKLSKFDIEISTIARGIAIGDELEYADEITLGKSIANRIHFEITVRG